jgi:hypothetical protein
MNEGSTLVVCPAILRFSWAEELERWLPFCLPADIHLGNFFFPYIFFSFFFFFFFGGGGGGGGGGIVIMPQTLIALI